MGAPPVLGERMYAITRYAEVRTLLSDPRCSARRLPSADELGHGDASLARPLELTINRMAAFSDPPRHDHVHPPLAHAFSMLTTGIPPIPMLRSAISPRIMCWRSMWPWETLAE